MFRIARGGEIQNPLGNSRTKIAPAILALGVAWKKRLGEKFEGRNRLRDCDSRGSAHVPPTP